MQVVVKPAGAVVIVGIIASSVVLVGRELSQSYHRDDPPVPQVTVQESSGQQSSGIVVEVSGWNKETGQARDWLFLGPIPVGDLGMKQILEKPFLPDETKTIAREDATAHVEGKDYTWRKSRGSAFDFKSMYSSPETPDTSLTNALVYGFTQIHSAKAQTKTLSFRSDDGVVVWLNGKQVHKITEARGITTQDSLTLPLKAGPNSLLVKVGQAAGDWGLMMQFEDLSGIG